MSGVTFVCPKCNQSLECDDSVQGQVVECPSCKTQITVPSGQQKKQIILPKASSSATPTPTSAPPPKATTGKVGLVVALVIGLVIGLIIGYGVGSAKSTSSNAINTNTRSATDSVASRGDTRGLLGGKSPYTVVYGKARRSTLDGRTYMVLTIKGPARELAVILSQPDGSEELVIVAREQMITNNREVSIPLSEKGRQDGGDYVLRIKTVDPEQIVFEETISSPPLSFRNETK